MHERTDVTQSIATMIKEFRASPLSGDALEVELLRLERRPQELLTGCENVPGYMSTGTLQTCEAPLCEDFPHQTAWRKGSQPYCPWAARADLWWRECGRPWVRAKGQRSGVKRKPAEGKAICVGGPLNGLDITISWSLPVKTKGKKKEWTSPGIRTDIATLFVFVVCPGSFWWTREFAMADLHMPLVGCYRLDGEDWYRWAPELLEESRGAATGDRRPVRQLDAGGGET